MRRLLPLILCLVLFGSLGAQSVVFHENFEQPSGADSLTAYSSSTANNWAISTDLAAGGLQSDSAICSPNDTLTLTTSAFSTTGNAFVLLNFDHICKIEAMDKAIVEVSTDGGISWTKLDTNHYMGNSANFGSGGNVFNATSYGGVWKSGQTSYTPNNTWWKHETFNISALAANTASVQVRFSLIDANGMTFFENYGWFLDNIEITAAPSELVPPVISLIPPIKQDTITSPSAQTVQAKITDNSGIDTAILVYYVNGNLVDTLGMTEFATDSFSADIPFVGFGRTVTWFVEAIDMATAANAAQTNNYSYFLKYLPLNVVQIGTGTTPQGYPFYTFYHDSRTQILLTASELQALGATAGAIDQIGFDITSAATQTMNGFNIEMKHTTTSTISSFSSTGFTNVYTGTYTVPGTGWQMIDLQNSFAWDGVSNILINICFDNTSYTSNTTVNSTAVSGMTVHQHTDGGTGCSLAAGTPQSNRPNIQLRISVPSTLLNDAGVAQIINPTGGVVANSNFDVKAKIKNFGVDTITSAEVKWELDGNAQTTYNYTGSLFPDSLSAELTLGTLNVGQGPHHLKLWTDNPNNTFDDNTGNDTMSMAFYGCANLLSGTYTIGGTSPDYNTFADALLGLTQCGINGPVTFNVAAGTYNEQLYIPAISGASATNTITFQSTTGDSTDVTVQYDANSANDNFVVKLDGASHINFNGMTFKAQDSAYARTFVMNNHSDNISLNNNQFIGKTVTSNSSDYALVFVEDTIGNDFTFTNNYLNNGSDGLYVFGDNISNVTVSGNILNNQFTSGISISGAAAAQIKNNELTTNSTSDSFNGIVLDNGSGQFEIAYNKVQAASTLIGYGITLNGTSGDSLNHGMVYNNMALINGQMGTTTLSCGIINMESKFVDYYFNTIKMTGADQNAPAFCLYDNTVGLSRGINVKNNNFTNFGNGYVIFIQNGDSALVSNDYNNLYASGSGDFISLNGTVLNDISEWQVATGEGVHTVGIDPYYSSANDLHTTNNLMDATGTPIAGITDDIDGDTRNTTTPDIGADEFDASPYDLTLLEILSPQSGCGLSSTESVTLRIKNIGSASISSFDANYQLLNGGSVVTETITNTLNPGDTLDYTFTTGTLDLDVITFLKDSIYPFRAYVSHSSDPIHQNDSLYIDINSQYQPPAPTTSPYTITYGDSVSITATSNDTLYWFASDSATVELDKGQYYTTPQLYDTTTFWVEARPGSANLKITEVTQYHGSGTGATTPSPSWLVGDDFVEITNLGTGPADLSGYVYNREGTGAFTYTLPAGLTLNSGEVLVLATYQGGSDDPANNYYVAASASTSSGSTTGHWLVDDQGSVVDAVALNGHSFSTTAVTSADWSGSIPSSSGNAGVVRTVDDNNTASDWQISSVVPQTLGAVNPALAGNLSGGGNSACPSARVPVIINVTGFPQDDAGISGIVSPKGSMPAGSQHYVDVELYNYGVNTLTSADISWELNGQLQNTFSWTGSIAYGHKDTIRIDSAVFAGGSHIIKAWTSLPNAVSDTINSNDTLNQVFSSCLNGYYTIGDTATGTYDFPTFTDAINALNAAGVCGNVTFAAESGTYSETLTLIDVPSMNAANTVTFTSITGDSTDVIIEGSPSSYSVGVLTLDAARYFTIKNMTIKPAASSSYGRVVYVDGGSMYNTFKNCVIETNVSTSTYDVPVYSDGSLDNYNKFYNNHMINGYYGIYWRGSGTTSRKHGNEFRNNVVENFYYYGMYMYYQDSVQITGNTISNRINTNYNYALYAYYVFDGFTIANNVIRIDDPSSTGTKYGLRVYYGNYYNYYSSSYQTGLVYNNMISINSGGPKYGLYAYYSNDVEYYYNTVSLTGTGTPSQALYQYNTTLNTEGEKYINNIFIDSVGEYAAYYGQAATVTANDYNNYYTVGSTLAYWNGDHATLADLQAQNNMDANSLVSLPLFVSMHDLHVTDKQLAGKGTPVPGISVDIDGDPRNAVLPAMGADEVQLLPVDIGIVDILNVPSTVNENDTIYPEVIVVNSGTDTVANYTIETTINNGTPILFNVTNDTILPFGGMDTIALAYYISPAGLYNLCANTVLLNDSNAFNDQSCQNVFGTPIFDGIVTSVDPLVSGCALTTDTISIMIRNIGVDTIQPGFPARYQVDGITLVEDTVNSQLLPGDSVYFQFSQLVDLSVTTFDSIFNIAAWIEVPGDNVLYNDTAYTESESKHTPVAPVVADQTINWGTNTTIIGSATAPIFWYYNDTIANQFFIGDTLVTDILYADTTFWFEAMNSSKVDASIGVGSSSQDYTPFYGWYDYGWSGMIYDAAEIGGPGMIDTITFFLNNTPTGYQMLDQRIYMTHTADAQFASANKPDPSTMTQVFQGDLVYNGMGAYSIILDNGFNYNGTDNLLIYTENHDGSYTSGQPSWVSDAVSNKVIYAYQDGTFPTGAGSYNSMRPVVRLSGSSAGCGSIRDSVNINVVLPAFNAGVTDVLTSSGCKMTANEPVTIEIINAGSNTITTGLTAKFKIDNQPYTTPEQVNLTIPSMDTVLYTFTTTADLAAGANDTSFVITAVVDLTGDTYSLNDTVVSGTISSLYTPASPVLTNPTITFGTKTNLSYTSTDSLFWYVNDSTTNEFHIGNSFTTPYLYDTTTYYVEQTVFSPFASQIGTGTQTTYYIPAYGFYDFGWSNTLYLSSEVGSAGVIDTIAFYVDNNIGSYVMPNQTMYMANSSLTTIGTAKPDPSTMTQVFDGSVDWSGPGWIYIPLDNSFFYDGQSSLQLYWENRDGSYSSGYPQFRGSSISSDLCVYEYQDGSFPTTSGSQSSVRPNIKMSGSDKGCGSLRVPWTVNVIGHPPIDGQLAAVLEPNTGQLKTDNEPVIYQVKNNGTDSLLNVKVGYIFDGQQPVEENLTVNMGPGDTLVHTFASTVNMTQFKSYPMTSYVNVVNDTVTVNDTIFRTVTNKLDYCISTATSTYDDTYIETVTLNGLNNTSTSSSANYTDFTASVTPPIVYPSTTHPMTVSMDAGYFNTSVVKVFIDANRDGVLDETTETFMTETINSSANQVAVSDITLPANASPGLTLMRIVLQETSNPADVHPCGTYGYGETEDYLVQITPLIPQDAGIIAINKPNKFMINANQQFEVEVKNYGSDTIYSVDVQYNMGTITGSYTYNTAIAPQDTAVVSMSNLTMPYGNHMLCANTVLLNDSNAFNDGHCKPIHRQMTTNPPYFDDFEVKNVFMRDTTTGKVTQWEFGTPMANNIMGAHSGQTAWMIDLDSNYQNSTTDILYSPKFAIGNTGVDSLIFWHYMDSEAGEDGGYVQYMNVTGNWTTLGYAGDPSAVNWYTDTVIGQPAFSGNTNGWIRSSICIDTAHVSNMASITQFRFVFSSGTNGNAGDGWAIDDFRVKIPRTQFDAGVTAVINPTGTTVTGDATTVEVTIRNFGYDPLTSTDVTYKVGNNAPVTETWSGNLATDATDNFTFTNTYNSPSTDYDIVVYTELANDGNHFNDTAKESIISQAAALDAGIVDIEHVGNSYNDTTLFGQDIGVRVYIHNYGSQTLTSMDVQYVKGTTPAVVETWNGNLASGDTVAYLFNTTYVSNVFGNYNVCAKSLLTGDADATNDETCVSWYGYNSIESNELPGFVLHQNIPNPANGATQVDFEVPYGGQAEFQLVDMFGRTLYVKDMHVITGRHSIDLDAFNLPAGIYYYSVIFDGHRLVRKMVVAK